MAIGLIPERTPGADFRKWKIGEELLALINNSTLILILFLFLVSLVGIRNSSSWNRLFVVLVRTSLLSSSSEGSEYIAVFKPARYHAPTFFQFGTEAAKAVPQVQWFWKSRFRNKPDVFKNLLGIYRVTRTGFFYQIVLVVGNEVPGASSVHNHLI